MVRAGIDSWGAVIVALLACAVCPGIEGAGVAALFDCAESVEAAGEGCVAELLALFCCGALGGGNR